MSKSYNKDYFSNRALKWEKNHGKFIHDFMFTEFSNRILGQCNVALNDLQRQLDTEIERATAEEKRLDKKIDSETSRATAEETRLDGKIDAETARATAEETRLDSKIDTEKTRLDGKIDEEITRAKGEETRLDGKIDTEKTRLDGKIDAETARATGRENELSTSINACLPKAGGFMNKGSYINWKGDSSNQANDGDIGGLYWSASTDSIQIYGDNNGADNLDLAIRFNDDNSNRISIRDKDGIERSAITSTGHFTGTVDWNHINNRPEIDKQTIDQLKQTCADLQARVTELEKSKA